MGSILFILGSSHSTLNSVSMIIMTTAYRRALLKVLPSVLRPKESGVTVVMTYANPK
jgi:hypothetical protein